MSKIIPFPSDTSKEDLRERKKITVPNFLAIILVDTELAPSLRELQKIINANWEDFEKNFKQFLAFREKESPEIQRKLLKHVYSTLIYLWKISEGWDASDIEIVTEEFITKFSAKWVLEFKKLP